MGRHIYGLRPVLSEQYPAPVIAGDDVQINDPVDRLIDGTKCPFLSGAASFRVGQGKDICQVDCVPLALAQSVQLGQVGITCPNDVPRRELIGTFKGSRPTLFPAIT